MVFSFLPRADRQRTAFSASFCGSAGTGARVRFLGLLRTAGRLGGSSPFPASSGWALVKHRPDGTEAPTTIVIGQIAAGIRFGALQR